MKVREIMKKILIILMIFVYLTTNYCYAAFYYSGTQKGTYNATSSIWSRLINSLADIADYVIGLTTWIFRMFLVGWTSIVELALNDTLEAATGDSPGFEINAATLDMTDSNDQRKVTVENIVFNKIPILDINFFDTTVDETVTGTGAIKDNLEEKNENGKTETSGAHKVTASGVDVNMGEKQEGIEDPDDPSEPTEENVIVIIKNTLANWYYAMRTFAVACMLIVLLYIALRLIVATVGEQKAKYKQMLYNWVVGFAVVFCIHYIMLFVILVNEELVGTFEQMSQEYVSDAYKTAEDKTNTEMELSLYTSLRSRAYEVKATRGWIGTILYMVLVYYAIRFTLVYLKRYFTIMILAMMAPVLSATYAFGKVRTGKAESFNKWLKEFVFSVLLQSVHAVTYVTLITQILKLTETSIIGAILAFMILNFMLKTDAIIKRIFNMSSSQHGALDSIMSTPGNIAQSVMALQGGAKVAQMYGKYWLKPIYGGMAKIAGAGLSIPGNALLGAAGGFIEHRNAHMELANPAKPEKFDPNNPNVKRDENGRRIGRNENTGKENLRRGAAHTGYDPMFGGLNSNGTASKIAEMYKKANDKRIEQGKEPYKWGERSAAFIDGMKSKALGRVHKAIYNSGYFGSTSVTSEIDSRIAAKQAKMREEAKKLQKAQIKQLTSATAGLVLTTISIPLLVANPGMGITLMAKGYSMSNSVAKYDKKGKIAKRSLGLRKVDVEVKKRDKDGKVVRDDNGKVVKETVQRYRVTGLMTSVGTFIKKGSGIAYLEGLTTNIGDDVDKVMKQNKKDIKELEMLYNERERLLNLEIKKQQAIIEQQEFLANPQQAMRKIRLRESYEDSIVNPTGVTQSGSLRDGTYSIYAGRVMETNEEMKKFLESKAVQEFMAKNGIGKAETIVAINALMAVTLEEGKGDMSKLLMKDTGEFYFTPEMKDRLATQGKMSAASINKLRLGELDKEIRPILLGEKLNKEELKDVKDKLAETDLSPLKQKMIYDKIKQGPMSQKEFDKLKIDGLLNQETKDKITGRGLTEEEIKKVQDVIIERKGKDKFEAYVYDQVMGKVQEEMKMMGLDKISKETQKAMETGTIDGKTITDEQIEKLGLGFLDEATKDKMKNGGLDEQEISKISKKVAEQRTDDIDFALTEMVRILQSDQNETRNLIRAIEVQEATAEALNRAEDRLTKLFAEGDVIKKAEEQNDLNNERFKLVEEMKKEKAELEKKMDKRQNELDTELNELINKQKELSQKTALTEEEQNEMNNAMTKIDEINKQKQALAEEKIASDKKLDIEMRIKEDDFNAKQRALDEKVRKDILEILSKQGMLENKEAYEKANEEMNKKQQELRDEELKFKNAYKEENKKIQQKETLKTAINNKENEIETKTDALNKMKEDLEKLKNEKATEEVIEEKKNNISNLETDIKNAKLEKEKKEQEIRAVEEQINARKEERKNAEDAIATKTKELEMQREKMSEDEKLMEKAIEDAESVAVGAKTQIEIVEAKNIKTEDVLKELEDSGGYRVLLDAERAEKPNECQKAVDKQLYVSESAETISIQVMEEDLEARKRDIENLINQIKDTTGENYREESRAENTRTWEDIRNTAQEEDRKFVDDDWYTSTAEVAVERKIKEDTKEIDKIKDEINAAVRETKTESDIEKVLQDMNNQGKETDLGKMSDDDLREFYKKVNNSDYCDEIKVNENESATKNATTGDIENLKTKIKEKMKKNISLKDKSKLNSYLEKMGSSISIDEYNKMVADYNSMNIEAEEAFIQEMKDEKSASNMNHNDDYVTTSTDKLRRGVNSKSVREAKGSSDIQLEIAEMLRSNDYAQYETVTVKSSSKVGKKNEKGPLISISTILSNLG